MKRREFMKAAAGVLAGIASVSVGYARESTKRSNILVFLVDDLGWGDLGCYGHPFMITPNLDRMAEQGMRFTDCHAGSSICSPSRGAI